MAHLGLDVLQLHALMGGGIVCRGIVRRLDARRITITRQNAHLGPFFGTISGAYVWEAKRYSNPLNRGPESWIEMDKKDG